MRCYHYLLKYVALDGRKVVWITTRAAFYQAKPPRREEIGFFIGNLWRFLCKRAVSLAPILYPVNASEG